MLKRRDVPVSTRHRGEDPEEGLNRSRPQVEEVPQNLAFYLLSALEGPKAWWPNRVSPDVPLGHQGKVRTLM